MTLISSINNIDMKRDQEKRFDPFLIGFLDMTEIAPAGISLNNHVSTRNRDIQIEISWGSYT